MDMCVITAPELAPFQGASSWGCRSPGLKPRAESYRPFFGALNHPKLCLSSRHSGLSSHDSERTQASDNSQIFASFATFCSNPLCFLPFHPRSAGRKVHHNCDQVTIQSEPKPQTILKSLLPLLPSVQTLFVFFRSIHAAPVEKSITTVIKSRFRANPSPKQFSNLCFLCYLLFKPSLFSSVPSTQRR